MTDWGGNYPPGGGCGAYPATATYKCPKCGNTWDVHGTRELGGWWADNEEDENCPDCGTPGV